ncbi:MAG: hypothetical protein ABI877_14685, partial [Gemmatimonadaceae bacterium]
MRFRLALAGVLTAIGSAAWPQVSPSVAGVEVQVVVDSGGRAQVVERYRVPIATGVIQLQFLQRACASVEAVTLSTDANSRVLAIEGDGPWVSLRDTTAKGRLLFPNSSGFDVSYIVSRTVPSADIPLVQLTRPIPRSDEEREGGVVLSVVTDGEVSFPRLTRTGPGQPWMGRFVAIPSFVRVDRKGGTTRPAVACGTSTPHVWSDGGLSWRFWTLVAIMIAWVPLYL